jgi:imidazolonepropionase-like amidohydrolase
VGGKTLLPGLIDGHIHLRAYAGKPALGLLPRTSTEQVLHTAKNARAALNAGVITVRDATGARLEVAVKHATDQQLLDGARVVAAGFVGMTGGHGDLFTPPAVDRCCCRSNCRTPR